MLSAYLIKLIDVYNFPSFSLNLFSISLNWFVLVPVAPGYDFQTSPNRHRDRYASALNRPWRAISFSWRNNFILLGRKKFESKVIKSSI